MLPMYMGVILAEIITNRQKVCAPHVYGGDPNQSTGEYINASVLPMYMGVILNQRLRGQFVKGAPHVYGGDPTIDAPEWDKFLCSPCIWG